MTGAALAPYLEAPLNGITGFLGFGLIQGRFKVASLAYLEVRGAFNRLLDRGLGPLKGLGGASWVGIRQVKSWFKHRDLEVRGTYNWLHNCSSNPLI